jgi:predicted nuclease of restriction endonuclease-like (RecB) superfamily
LKATNKELVNLYWDIGKMIVDKQTELGWGKSVVERLSQDLQKTYKGQQGFSPQNLWFMRKFYLEYYQNEILLPMVREIGWTQNLIIFNKCKDLQEREFYLLHVKKFGWTKDVLIHQISNKTYKKYLLNQTNFDNVLPEKYKQQAKLAVKDVYTFDFLELSNEHSENELELALKKNMQSFLIEMGHWFTFVGSQFKLKVGKKEYFIDLLLFHRKLRSLVAIELKIGEFQPEYKGKMEFYLTALNKQIKDEFENDSIGIIICKSKDRTVVEYSLSSSLHPIGVASYETSASLPEEYKTYLPSANEIANKLNEVKEILYNSEGMVT